MSNEMNTSAIHAVPGAAGAYDVVVPKKVKKGGKADGVMDMDVLAQAFSAHVSALADQGIFYQHKPERAALTAYMSSLAPVSIGDARAGRFTVRPELANPDAVGERTGLFTATVRSANTYLAMHMFIGVSDDTISVLSYDVSSEQHRRETIQQDGLALAPTGPLVGWLSNACRHTSAYS
jgi:hypothetical protein